MGDGTLAHPFDLKELAERRSEDPGVRGQRSVVW